MGGLRGGKVGGGRTVFGRWMAVAALLVVAMGGAAEAQDIAGTWQGTLAVGPPGNNKAQRIVLQVSREGAAGWRGVVYNLDGVRAFEGRATTSMSLQGAVVRFAIAPIESSLEGKLSEDGATIAGTWTQGGKSNALTLARAAGDAVWEIPKADAMMANDADPDWEVVTVKARDPNNPSGGQSLGMNGREFVIENKTVEGLLGFGYGVHKKQIEGAPDWIETERWDVRGVPDVPGHPNLKQLQSLTRKLLAERFGLKLHREAKELAVYAITVAKGGEKMARSVGDPNGNPDERDNSNESLVTMRLTNSTMTDFALALVYWLDRPAVDQTGLTGRYDFQLKWTHDESRAPTHGSAPPGCLRRSRSRLG